MIQFRITKAFGQELEACHPYDPALTKAFYGRTFEANGPNQVAAVAIRALTQGAPRD